MKNIPMENTENKNDVDATDREREEQTIKKNEQIFVHMVIMKCQ